MKSKMPLRCMKCPALTTALRCGGRPYFCRNAAPRAALGAKKAGVDAVGQRHDRPLEAVALQNAARVGRGREHDDAAVIAETDPALKQRREPVGPDKGMAGSPARSNGRRTRTRSPRRRARSAASGASGSTVLMCTASAGLDQSVTTSTPALCSMARWVFDRLPHPAAPHQRQRTGIEMDTHEEAPFMELFGVERLEFLEFRV